MAIKSHAEIAAAVPDLWSAFGELFTSQIGVRECQSLFDELVPRIEDLYRPHAVITAGGANVGALLPIIEAASGRAAVIGTFFEVTGAEDTTDTVLQTAKGSAPVAGDRFAVDTGNAIRFIGNGSLASALSSYIDAV